MKMRIGKRGIAWMLMAALLLLTLPLCAGAEGLPRVGVAWRSNPQSESFVATCEAIEAAGGLDSLAAGLVRRSVAKEAGKATLSRPSGINDIRNTISASHKRRP